MKQVSFKVAKAIKEAEYPQDVEFWKYLEDNTYWYYQNGMLEKKGNISDYVDERKLIFAPTYLEVWLWLWKEKKIYIDIAHYYNSDEITVWDTNYKPIDCIDCFNKYTNPEDAIAEAINRLVDNDLIK